MRRAKFLSHQILVERSWNWNLKFGFLGSYGQKTIFQTRWTKNTEELKTYLIWLSSTVWRGQFALKFFAHNIWKENVTKYLCYFHKFSVQDHLHEYLRVVLCCFRLYLRGFNLFLFYDKTRVFGWRNTDRNWICCSAILFQTAHRNAWLGNWKLLIIDPIVNIILGYLKKTVHDIFTITANIGEGVL